jgi:hypothetical protein
MLLRHWRKVSLLPAAVLALAVGCGGDETAATEDHVPVEYIVFVDGTEVTAPYNLVVGETARVQIQFFNEAGDNLDDVEDSHFAGLTFDPPSIATVTRVPDHNYQFDVTGNTVGAALVTISYGHEENADEIILDDVPVNVVANSTLIP